MTDMDDEVSVSIALPLDDDGFLRRECPSCVQQFKCFSHGDESPDAEHVDQYFCPLCGAVASTDMWWTPEQIEYAEGIAAPELDQIVNDALGDMFKDLKGIKGISVTHNRDFSFEIPAPRPLTEPNDMVIVEPPCHPNEPLKVPEEATPNVRCLICGQPFTA